MINIIFSIAILGNAFANEPDEELNFLNEINAQPSAEQINNKKKPRFDSIEEEEENTFDFSGPAAVPVADPDQAIAISNDNEASDVDLDALVDDLDGRSVVASKTPSKTATEPELNDLEEPQPVDEAAKNIDWSFDEDEEIELNQRTVPTEKKETGAPVNLDFLDED